MLHYKNNHYLKTGTSVWSAFAKAGLANDEIMASYYISKRWLRIDGVVIEGEGCLAIDKDPITALLQFHNKEQGIFKQRDVIVVSEACYNAIRRIIEKDGKRAQVAAKVVAAAR